MAEPVASCGSSAPATWTYDQKLAIEELFKHIITKKLPFDTFSSPRWTRFIQQNLQPAYERLTKHTIKRLACKCYIKAKKDLIAYFENFQGKVSLTIQVWDTDFIGIEYRAIRCSWVDPDTWKMSKRTIYVDLHGDIHEAIMDCVNDFGIKDKFFSICFDDVGDGIYAEGVEKAKMDLKPLFDGVLFETKCMSHVLISMVQMCLDHVDSLIWKVRKILDFANRLKCEEFAVFLREKGVKFNDPGVNWPHMWNTTYKMLRGVLAQKALLVEFYANSDKYAINDSDDNDIDDSDDNDIDDSDENDIHDSDENDIHDSDWVIVKSLLGILKVFHSSTVRLSNAKSPSAPLLLGECLLISDMFKKYKQDPFWQPVIAKMQSKFLKYCITIPPVFSVATALNPKIGVKGVENILEDIEANLGLSNDMNDSTFAKASIAKFNSALQEMFDHYDAMHKSRPREQAPVTSTARNIIHQSVSRKRSENGSISSDLELYNKTDFSQVMTSDDEETKMLEWWSIKGCQLYPVLGAMARDLLTVQACVEDLQYAFCFKGRELGENSMSYAWWLQRRIFLKERFDEVGWEDNGELVEDLEVECEGHNYDFPSDASDEE